MKTVNVKYAEGGKIQTVSENSLFFEQENESLTVSAELPEAFDSYSVRVYSRDAKNNSYVSGKIEKSADGKYNVTISSEYMSKGTLYVGYELYNSDGYAERLEPLKIYIDSWVTLGNTSSGNVYVVTVNVGSTETLEAGSDATVTNSGTEKDMILNFGIPKGDKGDKGDTGDKGDKGDKGDRGEKGEPFVYSDFTADQLALLKGEKGDKGDTGAKGEHGEKGAAFVYSDFTSEQLELLKGPKGDKGDTGAKGEQGIQGIKGDAGHTPVRGTDYWTEEDKAEIFADVQAEVGNKVDKETGKGLSSNDYTDVEKAKLAGLNNYDDSEVKSLILNEAAARGVADAQKVDKVAGKELSANDFTDEDKNKLNNLSEKVFNVRIDMSEDTASLTGRQYSVTVDNVAVETTANTYLGVVNDFTKYILCKLSDASVDDEMTNSPHTFQCKLLYAKDDSDIEEPDFAYQDYAYEGILFYTFVPIADSWAAQGTVYDSIAKCFYSCKYEDHISTLTTTRLYFDNPEITNELKKKVDKIAGKGLSANDFTNEEKSKLDTLPTYEEYSAQIGTLEQKGNKVTEISDNPTDTEYPSAKAVKAEINKQKEYVNNTFANALIGNRSGSSVVLDGISPIEHEVGVSVGSKNLLKYPYYSSSYTGNGVTFTVNEDGTVLVNGTATAQTHFYCSANSFTLPEGTYTISGTRQGGSRSTDVYINGMESNIILGSRTVNWAGGKVPLHIVIDKGVTAENVLVKPQIEEGTTASEYTPYISDLTSVTVKKCGKNLIPFPYASNTVQTVNGVTYTPNSNGSIVIDGTATGQISFEIFKNTQKPIMLSAGTYVLSGIPSESGASPTTFYMQIYYDGKWGVIDVGSGGAFTVSNTVAFKRITLFIKTGVEFTNLAIKPQLEVGTTATEYEQYNGETYTPSASGTVSGVKSLYPITTLLTNNSGAVITAEYNRDINKAFSELEEKLTNAILSTGGNV